MVELCVCVYGGGVCMCVCVCVYREYCVQWVQLNPVRAASRKFRKGGQKWVLLNEGGRS